MNDLINRLRDCGPPFSADGPELLMAEAADTIERMEREIRPWVERYHETYKELVGLKTQLEQQKAG